LLGILLWVQEGGNAVAEISLHEMFQGALRSNLLGCSLTASLF